MDKAKLAEHWMLWLMGAGIVAFVIFAALNIQRTIPSIGRAVLVPFDNLLTKDGVNLISTTTEPVATSTTKSATTTAIVNTQNITKTTTPETKPVHIAKTIPVGQDLFVSILVASPTSVRFNIINNGGTTVPYGWTFTATLPSSYQYVSPAQPALASGQGFIYTLNINNQSQTQNGGATYPITHGTFTVLVDQQGATADINRSNNSASAGI